MFKADRIRLQHMLDAAREAMASLHGRRRSDLDQDVIWALGLIKSVEMIGEAASRISAETQGMYPEVPWGAIVAMRNRLVHVYFDIDLDQVWNTLTQDLPILAAQLDRILQEDRDNV